MHRIQTPAELPDHLPPPLPRWVLALWIACLLFGAFVRFLWPRDMEWKADEIYSVTHARTILQTGHWPATGMSTSVGPPNPGLSLWAFVPLVAFARSPIGVCLLVMLGNTLALAGFALWTLRQSHLSTSPDHPAPPPLPLAARLAPREAWIWAAATLAVNPYAVRIARKIWPPSLLAPCLLLFFLGHHRRHTRIGAFLWGIAGALMTQIHLSGAFLAGGVALLTAARQARRRDPSPPRWLAWTLGSALASLGFLPWLLHLRANPSPTPSLGWSLESFYLRITLCAQYLAELALGLTTRFSYGSDQLAFLSGPNLLGQPTFILGLLHLALFLCASFLIATYLLRPLLDRLPQPVRRRLHSALRTFRKWWSRELPAPLHSPLRSAWLTARRLIHPRTNSPIPLDPDARFWLAAATLAGPALLILACRIIHMHYVYIFIPFLFLALPALAARRRRLLALILILQAALTLATLLDIHQQGGTIAGDYGRAFRAQEL